MYKLPWTAMYARFVFSRPSVHPWASAGGRLGVRLSPISTKKAQTLSGLGLRFALHDHNFDHSFVWCLALESSQFADLGKVELGLSVSKTPRVLALRENATFG